jgi:hypothetical protein
MPYIVCVNLPGCLPVSDPIAYSTLEEVRDQTDLIVRNSLDDCDGWNTNTSNVFELCNSAQTINDDGGIIGPLPDGYIIEVTRVSWDYLVGPENWNASTTEQEIIDAYNQNS